MPKSGEKPATRLREATALLDSPQITAMFEKVRTAVATPPPEPSPTALPRTGRGSRLAAAGIAVVALLTWWCYGGSASPWMRLTLPGGARSANVVAGETSLYNGDFFHNESLVALRQLDMLKGSGETLAGKIAVADPHIGYAVLGDLFTVGLNSPYALWAFNLVLYGLCALLVARLTNTLFADGAKAQLAAALFVLSIAATVHVGDLSPHLLTIAFSYLWTLLLLRIELEDRPLTGPTLFGLSALLGAWSLVSATSLFGLATLAIFLCKRRNSLAVVLPVLAWYAIPQLQHAVFGHLGWALPAGTDANMVWQGLQQHWPNLAANPLRYCCYLAVELGNYVLNDNPLNVLIGVVGLVVLRHRAKWLLWVCFLGPTAVSLALLPTTAARGSAVAGNAIILFAIVAHLGVEASRQIGRRLGPQPASLLLVALLAVQAVWGHSVLVGWLYPAGAYATGAFENAGLVRPVDFVRMTGSPDEKPSVVGGGVSAAVSYGLDDGFGRQPYLPVKRLAPYVDRWSGLRGLLATLILQAPLFGCLLAAALTLMRLRWGLLTMVILAASFGGAQLSGAATGLDRHVLRPFDDRIVVKEDEKLVAHLNLSDEFREILERAARDNLSIEFAWRLRGVNRAMAKPAEIQVDEWASDEPRLAVDAPAFLAALKAHGGRVELAISPKAGSRGVLVHSWQALGNPDGVIAIGRSAGGREATIVRPDGSTEPLEWFPSFEIRVVRGTNAYPFKTTVEPFESSRPTGYVLIGF
ncbi:MAG TPA: hypothetical protein VMR25_13230 [Planctomycetaceae bacterium]|jgi:hypothetical protein|nr:hypothetical protein [Planctomycetaceae bacterium]